MQRKPFTLEQAIEIAEDFEDLVDTELNNRPPIDYVTIGPANLTIEDEAFFNAVKEMPAHRDSYTHHSNEYDVYIIWMSADLGITEMTDIRTLVEANGIQYNFPA